MSARCTPDRFCLCSEEEAISVGETNIAPFSLPEELLTFKPQDEAVVTSFRNGETERRIHRNVELNEMEQEQLANLRELANSKEKSFFPSLASSATRYLGRNKGDVKRAFADMLATQEWREGYFKGPITDESVIADLAQGAVYFTGRDRFLRPALVVRPSRMPQEWAQETGPGDNRILRLICFSLEYMLRYMVLPGRVETGVIILDLQDLTLSQLPISVLKHMLKVLSNHYANRISTFYILNMPRALRGPSQFGLRLLTDRQRQKLRVVVDPQELAQEFALHHLEEDLGGTRSTITTFFPFPLQAGPFEAGCSTGPNAQAIPNAHSAFNRTCVLGRTWDPAVKNSGENSWLEFDSQADLALLRRCGLLELSQEEQSAKPSRPDELAAPTLLRTPYTGGKKAATCAPMAGRRRSELSSDGSISMDFKISGEPLPESEELFQKRASNQPLKEESLVEHGGEGRCVSHQSSKGGLVVERGGEGSVSTWEGESELASVSIKNKLDADVVLVETDTITPVTPFFCWLPKCK